MVLLYYRFIRLLWVGPSVQPSLRVVFLEEKEKDRDDGNPVVGRAHALCPLLGLRGVWGCAEARGRGYRASSPGSVCPRCISGVWMLLPVLLCNLVQRWTLKRHRKEDHRDVVFHAEIRAVHSLLLFGVSRGNRPPPAPFFDF